MPWAWEMGNWLLDTTQTGLSNRARFRRPYPRKNYSDDIKWNKPILDCIDVVFAAYDVFSLDPGKWDKAHRNFYKAMLDGLENGKN
jgi:hypothetical protein